MKRLVALVLCALLVGAACSERTSTPAATINGHDVPTDELVDELNAILGNQDYINALQTSGGAGFSIVGTTPNSFDAAFVSQVLLRQMDYKLINAEIAKRKVPINDECRRPARDDAMLNLGQGDANAGEALFAKFDKNYQDLLVQRNSEVIALQAALSGQICGKALDAQSFYNGHPEEFTKLCISVIAVTDSAQADSIVGQARGGADFAALARQFSIDDSTKADGGSVGCRLPSDFNATIAAQLSAAKPGDVLDPLPGQGGFSVLKLTDKQLAPFAEVQSAAQQLAQQSETQAFGSWLREARANAQVTNFDRCYGTFDAAQFQIRPPTSEVPCASAEGSSSTSEGSSSTDSP